LIRSPAFPPLATAEVSNPAGWRAIGDASRRLGLPHLPNGLAARLAGADLAMYETQDADVLGERARAVVEAAGWFEGRADDFAVALGEDPDLPLRLPDWLVSLPLDLGRAGLGAEAIMVGDALGSVAPEGSAPGMRWPRWATQPAPRRTSARPRTSPTPWMTPSDGRTRWSASPPCGASQAPRPAGRNPAPRCGPSVTSSAGSRTGPSASARGSLADMSC